MRTVSTGAGLCVLGVCVLGAAALSSPRLGNAAIAAGGAQRSSLPATAIRPEPNPMQRNPIPSNSSLTDCEVRVEHWFSPTPHLIQDCGTLPILPYAIQSNLDLLGDGNPRIIFNDPYDPNLTSGSLFVNEFRQLPDGTTRPTRVVILSPDDSELINNFLALGLGSGSSDANMGGGIADMDGDRDLDIVIACASGQRVWLENIRGDAVRPNLFDLDHDGHVNNADLSLLLMEYTD
jgi:hypothetical protein